MTIFEGPDERTNAWYPTCPPSSGGISARRTTRPSNEWSKGKDPVALLKRGEPVQGKEMFHATHSA